MQVNWSGLTAEKLPRTFLVLGVRKDQRGYAQPVGTVLAERTCPWWTRPPPKPWNHPQEVQSCSSPPEGSLDHDHVRGGSAEVLVQTAHCECPAWLRRPTLLVAAPPRAGTAAPSESGSQAPRLPGLGAITSALGARRVSELPFGSQSHPCVPVRHNPVLQAETSPNHSHLPAGNTGLWAST